MWDWHKTIIQDLDQISGMVLVIFPIIFSYQVFILRPKFVSLFQMLTTEGDLCHCELWEVNNRQAHD